jgi:hypothetical protein
VILFQFDDTEHGGVLITKGFTQHAMAVYYSLAFPKLLSWSGPGQNAPTFHSYADYVQVSRDADEVISTHWSTLREARSYPR